MLRSSLFTASAFALVASAAAQTPQTLTAEKVPGAIKHAGIYHVSTGTWTRTGGAVANFGPDTIYSNTAESGYYSSAGGAGGFAPNSTNFDEGNIPSSLNTNNPGGRDAYNVNCVEIGYCDFGAAGTGGWELSFYNSYAPCTFNGTPDNTIATAALPAGGCWFVAFDLSGGNEICIEGDGGDGFDDDAALDSFGWSYRYTGTDGSAAAGFLLTGDPAETDPNFIIGGNPVDGTNTFFGPASLCGADDATGLLTRDFWWLEDPTATNSNCFWFGGYSNNNGCGSNFNPLASWHFEIYAEGLATSIGTNYCPSTPNSTGVMTELTASGSDVALDDNVCLLATNLVPGAVGFFITSETQGFVMNPGGSNGNLCVVGEVGRFLQNIQQFKTADAAGTMSLDTSIGEWSLTNIPTAVPPLFYSATAGMTTNFQLWHRDIGGSNFSNGLSISWQ